MDALIYNPVDLSSLIQHVVQHSVPTAAVDPASTCRDPPIRIIACCTREVFQAHLLHSVLEGYQEDSTSFPDTQHEGADYDPLSETAPQADTESVTANERDVPKTTDEHHSIRPGPLVHPLLKQTLRTIFASAAIRMAFCDSAPVLYAYLTALAISSEVTPDSNSGDDPKPPAGDSSSNKAQACSKRTLILLNPVAMHRDSSSYSAQGISRTLAAAFEAAWRMEMDLVVVETTDAPPASSTPGVAEDDAEIEQLESEVDTGASRTDANLHPTQTPGQNTDSSRAIFSARTAKPKDPWDAEIPIVNSTTKSFGTALNRAQMARKTTVKAVAARWFRFQSLP